MVERHSEMDSASVFAILMIALLTAVFIVPAGLIFIGAIRKW